MPALVLLLDAATKLVKPGFVVRAKGDLGFPESVIVPLGIVLAGCTILYLIPRTTALGAILLAGHLGGAIAARVRHEDSWLPIVFLRRFRRPSVERAAARRTAACGAALEPLADLGGRGTLW